MSPDYSRRRSEKETPRGRAAARAGMPLIEMATARSFGGRPPRRYGGKRRVGWPAAPKSWRSKSRRSCPSSASSCRMSSCRFSRGAQATYIKNSAARHRRRPRARSRQRGQRAYHLEEIAAAAHASSSVLIRSRRARRRGMP